jgi:dihydrofolate reductase
MGANTAKQCIEAGLLDVMRVHIVPYLLGDRVRLFDHLGTHLVELQRTGIIESSSGVTQLFFSVVKQRDVLGRKTAATLINHLC